MPDPIEVRKIPLHSVSDASELTALIDAGVFDADRIVAVIGKTEGNGGVNDYTRIIADRAFREVLEARGTRSMDEIKQIPIVWSGGTDGVISPHATIFATTDAAKVPATDEPRHRSSARAPCGVTARGHPKLGMSSLLQPVSRSSRGARAPMRASRRIGAQIGRAHV